MAKMNWKKFITAGILAGIVITIVSLIVDTFIVALWPYNILELGGMRAVTDPMMMLYFLSPWVIGFTMSYAYPYVEKGLKGSYIKKGKMFGLLVWLVASVPSAFIVYTSMNYPIGFTVSSVIGTLIYMVAAGITIAKFMK